MGVGYYMQLRLQFFTTRHENSGFKGQFLANYFQNFELQRLKKTLIFKNFELELKNNLRLVHSHPCLQAVHLYLRNITLTTVIWVAVPKKITSLNYILA